MSDDLDDRAMSRGAQEPGLPLDAASSWLVFALAGVFVSLGLLFLFAPRAGAGLFGIPAPAGQGLAYVIAIGLRDLAFGLCLFALACLASRRIVGTVLSIMVLIPVGDVVLVAAERGFAPGHLLLHAASGLILAASSAWLLAQAAHH
jgi:Domain of unknown function (DUF4267)